jgi:amino acid transporter
VTLTLYGVGVIVGAGIYVLVGEVVSMARSAAWLSFLCASAAALPTGLSYAELASRYPESAGEAVYADRAFGRAFVTALTYLERARDLGLIDLDWIRRRGDFVCGLGRAWRAQRRRSGRPRGVVGPGAHGRLGMWSTPPRSRPRVYDHYGGWTMTGWSIWALSKERGWSCFMARSSR